MSTTLVLTSLGTLATILENSLRIQTQWGIFDSKGNQLGSTADGSNGLLQTIAQNALVGPGAILSTNAFEFEADSRISDFPIERGGFASYNKVHLPTQPTVTLAFSGSVSDRTSFLNQLETARKSNDLYSVKTPEITYYNYSIERYTYARRSTQGATLLIVELNLKEIRQVSAAYSTTQTAINQPQNATATPQTSSGIVQSQDPNQSTLKSLATNFPNLRF